MGGPDRRRWALLAVILATFITYLDNNIVNVAVPSIQLKLKLSTTGLEWVLSSYILVFGSLLLVGGRLADLYGRRGLFLVGLCVFGGASLLAGLAANEGELIASRAAQGLGAAAITPTTLAIISTLYATERERSTAVGVWNAVGALALALGPLVGGVISQHLFWGWIFFINVPIAAVTVAVGLWAIPAQPTATQRRRVDAAGLLCSTSALFALTYALIEGTQAGWGSAWIVAGFVSCAAFGLAFVAVEHRAAHPMLSLGLLRDRTFGGGISVAFVWAFGIFGIYLYTSLYLQNVLHFSPTVAGLAFVPMALLMVGGSILSEPAARRLGAHRSVAGSMLVIAIGMAGATFLPIDATFGEVMVPLIVIGIGGGFTTALTASVVNALPAREASVASAVFSTARQTGGLLGIAGIGAVLLGRRADALRHGRSATDAFWTGYKAGLLLAAILVALGAVAAFFALRKLDTPEEASGN